MVKNNSPKIGHNKKSLLKHPIEHIDIKSFDARKILESMGNMSFTSRDTARAARIYNEMLAAGIAKECARDVLPLSTPTKLYMNGTLRSWLHYTDLRCANGTQLEHQLIATGVHGLIRTNFPLVAEAMWPTRAERAERAEG